MFREKSTRSKYWHLSCADEMLNRLRAIVAVENTPKDSIESVGVVCFSSGFE